MTVAAVACPMMPWASMTGHSVATMPLPAREIWGSLGQGWGWMDRGGRHFGPKLLDETPWGEDDQLLFGPLSSPSCLSLGRYGH